MALIDMIGELQGSVSGIDAAQARTLVQEAWADVRRLGGWSFQFGETGFTIPSAISTGSVTLQYGTVILQLGSPYVIGDAAATSAWNTPGIGSQFGSLITQRQFRAGGTSGAGTIYDIVAYDDGQTVGVGNYPFATITLNRPFSDPLTSMDGTPVPSQHYMIYQPYIVAPTKGFRRWLSVYDIANSGWLFTRGDRREIGLDDPQRQIFSNPDRLLALGTDTRAGSSTAGWQRYELWPGPENQYLYQAWYLHFGPDLVNLTDELPVGIPESLVKARARVRCYENAEANKDAANPRGAGADYRFLMGAAEGQYKSELKQARIEDRDKVDIFVSTMHRFRGGPAPTTFNPFTGGIRSQVGV